MVLGIRSKGRKSVAVQVEYLIHVQEIKPWPLSQSSKSVQSVLLQWENGDQASGSFICGVGDGKIGFTESFRLPVLLCRETSRKGPAYDSYQKNNLEFYLYESRKDKAMKGQLLGSALINLADYGIIRETTILSTPLNCKKSFKNSGQPLLYLNIQPLGNDSSSSSPKTSFSKEVSLENAESESVSEAMVEENDEEAEIASFTGDDEDDDDVSSQSSRTVNSSPFERTVGSTPYSVKIRPEMLRDDVERNFGEATSRAESARLWSNPLAKTSNHPKENSSALSSIGYSSNLSNSANDDDASTYIPQDRPVSILKKSVTHGVRPSSTMGYQDRPQKPDNIRVVDSRGQMPEYGQESMRDNVVANLKNKVGSSSMYIKEAVNGNHTDSLATKEGNRKVWSQSKNVQEEATLADSLLGPSGDHGNKEHREDNGRKEILLKLKEYSFDVKQASRSSEDARTNDSSAYSNRDIEVPSSIVKNNKLKHVKSVQLPFETAKNNRPLDNTELIEKPKRTEITKDAPDGGMTNDTSVEKETSIYDSKGELESEIEMLKEELREAAAVEVGLYSVVAEHGSSTNKIHAPARRLSRFYLHACKAGSKAKKANAARAAISGFLLVSKACGNDVPRLTFWLSNSIVLRAIVNQTVVKQQHSDSPFVKTNGGGKFSSEGLTLGQKGYPPHREEKNDKKEISDNWDDPQTFMIALEKFESWIFSRIVESVWWQTMTPHMQPAAAKGSSSKKAYGRKHGFGDHEQGNFSIELWKKAFKDACQRLCPARAGGHECGCLPVLARLVMEQMVDRLDVAMFNAILRENAEEMPTDPVSDPISDSKVLPIPAGRSSFGAGAQLKNAIGSWSRCLADIFDIDDAPDDESVTNDEDRPKFQTSFKAFRLLNALSDLMMIPFEMLADKSIRKEVCPTLSAPLIKMVLYNFVPDEFCPNPIPEAVFEALDSEDNSENGEESLTSFPFTANPTFYSPPSAASQTGIIGETGNQTLLRSGSSVLKKSYTSDDELDELDSPITSIIKDNFQQKRKGLQVVRYQLLREVWKDSE
ncbi:EEIG1/EHBP1 N-terminal domain containing protein [Parasponia andersonii]|uniref:EEIG1/EHBP1 N-terminal domain containing protein n=1 Tax=Parasponia andersonii TaxID=3476 RepID=A0A2P5BUI7_PARAD|nr:EEIG1/EHBP1 N-terminal domain containing protein [Parasponia andersonii]